MSTVQTTQKKRYPYADALAVAQSLKNAIAPFCTRIEICGSLRRKKREVGDIEILYVSKVGTRQADLLSTEEYSLANKFIDSLLALGEIAKRPSIRGFCAWGDKNRLGVHVASGIAVDFFATSEICWWNSLVCRTGGKDSNLLITTTAQRLGYSFEAYGSGFRSIQGDRGGHHETTSERDVFEFISLPYLQPEDRR